MALCFNAPVRLFGAQPLRLRQLLVNNIIVNLLQQTVLENLKVTALTISRIGTRNGTEQLTISRNGTDGTVLLQSRAGESEGLVC